MSLKYLLLAMEMIHSVRMPQDFRPGFVRILVGFWSDSADILYGFCTGSGRVCVGVSVYGDLDAIRIVFFCDGRFGQVVLLPMSVEISKAHPPTQNKPGFREVEVFAPSRWRLSIGEEGN